MKDLTFSTNTYEYNLIKKKNFTMYRMVDELKELYDKEIIKLGINWNS